MACTRYTPLLLVLLAGCSALDFDAREVPDSTLVDVLVELHLVEARIDAGFEVPVGLRDSIFQHYEVTEEAVTATLEYYVEHPQEYLQLMEDVQERLSRATAPAASDSLSR